MDTFAEFTLDNLRAWLADEVAAGKKKSTLARRTAAVRAFSTWAYKEGYLEADVAARLISPKVNRALPTVVSQDTAAALVTRASIDNTKDSGDADSSHASATEHPASGDTAIRAAADLRDTAMLELLYATGMRVGELTGSAWPVRSSSWAPSKTDALETQNHQFYVMVDQRSETGAPGDPRAPYLG